MNLCLRAKSWRSNVVHLLRYSTSPTELTEPTEQVIIDDSEDALAREEEIDKKRNVSRLNSNHFNVMNGRPPYDEPKTLAHMTLKYHRKLYGKYGMASGVDPSLCWPTKQELQDKIDYESVAYPYTIKQAMEQIASKRKEEQEEINKRQAEIVAKFAKLDQWKKELNLKIEKKEAEALAAKEKKQRLVEEVRRHFGFQLDPRDDRFKEMLEKREKEQKKLEKQAKRAEKEKAMLAKIAQQNAEISELQGNTKSEKNKADKPKEDAL